jgi:hypothetical protein
MSKMFESVDDTWNVVKGCRHGCTWCWARGCAETRLRHNPRYRDGFEPAFFPGDLERRFKPGQFILVAEMGDLFGQWVPGPWIAAVLAAIRTHPRTDFLLMTKNPARYHSWTWLLPKNACIGTTIETNRPHGGTRAPQPDERALAMMTHPHPHKFVSIEPLMDFDVPVLVNWIEAIGPDIVEVGADNSHSGLPEPCEEKARDLIAELSHLPLDLRIKDTTERLLGHPVRQMKPVPSTRQAHSNGGLSDISIGTRSLSLRVWESGEEGESFPYWVPFRNATLTTSN